MMVDEKEFWRWFKQAEHNLISAKNDALEAEYDWACFKAQQAAEIAIKALIVSCGKIVKGHSSYDLLKHLEEFGLIPSDELFKRARKIDKFYIPTRYPDAIGLGSPYESFDMEDSNYAINSAELILSFIKETFEKCSK